MAYDRIVGADANGLLPEIVRNNSVNAFQPKPPIVAAPNTDLNTLLDTATYNVYSTAKAINCPKEIVTGRLQVTRHNNNVSHQIFEGWDMANPYLAQRSYYHGTWGSWIFLGRQVSDSNVALKSAEENLVRLSLLRSKRGPVEVTTPATVSLIFDHGFTNFKNLVWPLLSARGLPVTCAINSDLMDSDSRNSGATWDDLKAWSATGLMEPANHGRTHMNQTTLEGSITEYRGGREAIESAMGETVDTFITANSSWGSTIADLVDTPRGQVCMASHAIVTGMMPPASNLYPIDGVPSVGGGTGVWIDTLTSDSSVKNHVANAVAKKKHANIRFHPQFLDTSGYITTATLTSILDYLVAEQTAGRIKVLQFRDASIAQRN